jgi:hypothetical protein
MLELGTAIEMAALSAKEWASTKAASGGNT